MTVGVDPDRFYDAAMLDEAPVDPGRDVRRLLSPRELEVLEAASHGQTNAQVATALGVTVHAVKFHLASIFRKLGVHNRTEAVVAFLQSPPR